MQTNQPKLELPASVRRQLDGFSRRLCAVETLFAVLGAAGGLLAAYLLLFLSDRVWDTPAWLRVVLMASAVGCVVVFTVFWSRRWVWWRRDERALACMVQSKFPRLGDRLLGIVELADESRRPSNISPTLCRAALEQVAAEAAPLNFQGVVPVRSAKLSAMIVSVVGALVLAGVLLVPVAGLNALHRWLRPLAVIPRYTLVQVDDLPERRVVAYGEPFDVAGRIRETSRWFPERARGRFEDEAAIEAPATDRKFVFHVPGQTRQGNFMVGVGDVRQPVQIVPTFRPELLRLNVVVTFPEYLGYPTATLDARSGTAEILEGSKVALVGQASRRLAAATLAGATPLAVRQDEFTSEPVVVEDSKQLTLGWRDELGLQNKSPFVLKLNAQKDQAPVVDCQKLGAVTAMLEDETLEFEVVGEDDYGVKEVGLTWEGQPGKDAKVMPTKGEVVVAKGTPQAKRLSAKFRLVPQAMGLGPQTLMMRAVAVDYFPGRKSSVSPAYQVLILTYEQHAELLQKKFEELQERLEEIARTEEGAYDVNQQLRELSTEELAKVETAARLAAQEQAENANTREARKLQEELQKLVREALRNQSIPASIVSAWTKLIQTLQPVPTPMMPQVSEALHKAQGDPAQRAKTLAAALEQQEKVIARLMKALRELNEANERMQASSFVNRLRQAAKMETEAGGTLKELLPQTAGMSVKDLAPLLKTKLDTLGEQQMLTQKDVQYIRDDLGHFVQRTRQERFRDVHHEMQETQVVEELGKLASVFQQNLAVQGIEQATKWASQLSVWAERLQPPAEGGSVSGEGGNGEMSAAALEMMLKLLRIREREEGLREATRDLEEHKVTAALYTESAQQYGRIQNALAKQIQDIVQSPICSSVREVLQQVEVAMDDASKLLNKPQTDGETIAAETEVIELLSASCSGMGGGSGNGSGAGMMAMLQQMFGLGAGSGQSGGGSTQGGWTDRANAPVTSSTTGDRSENRSVEKAGGHDASKLPAEFRDALESYFEAVEKLK